MNRLKQQGEHAINKVPHVAIAITATRKDQRHLGILHRNHDLEETKLLHLAWHHLLKDEVPTTDFRWVSPSLHPTRARQVAARCRQVSKAFSLRAEMPYGFSPPTDCFSEETAQFLFGASKVGLTCATFALAIFEFAGVTLAKYDSWLPRPDDSDWQGQVLEMLENHGASTEHLTAVRNEIGSLRFRPEEVAAAAIGFPPAIDFATAKQMGESIVAVLNDDLETRNAGSRVIN